MTPSMMDFRRQPPATDLLAEFRKKFVALAERRTAELRAFMDEHCSEGPSEELLDARDEYDSLRYFEQELHRVIQAFVVEAVAPWQQAVTDMSVLRFDMLPMSKAGGTHAAAGKDRFFVVVMDSGGNNPQPEQCLSIPQIAALTGHAENYVRDVLSRLEPTGIAWLGGDSGAHRAMVTLQGSPAGEKKEA